MTARVPHSQATQLTEDRAAKDNPRNGQSIKSLYQASHQVEFLSLQAQVESLLQQLQALQQSRLSSGGSEAERNLSLLKNKNGHFTESLSIN